MSKGTGGPAFPVPDSEYQIQDTGMTLRDYFAGKAIQGMLANGVPPGEIPLYAYEIADAMLAARNN